MQLLCMTVDFSLTNLVFDKSKLSPLFLPSLAIPPNIEFVTPMRTLSEGTSQPVDVCLQASGTFTVDTTVEVTLDSQASTATCELFSQMYCSCIMVVTITIIYTAKTLDMLATQPTLVYEHVCFIAGHLQTTASYIATFEQAVVAIHSLRVSIDPNKAPPTGCHACSYTE